MYLYTDVFSQISKKLIDPEGDIRNIEIKLKLILQSYLKEVCEWIKNGIETLYFSLS